MAKLSKTMQDVMDKLHAADWYYTHSASHGGLYLATPNGVRGIGFEKTAIVKGGYVYARMSSSTLAALEKRGLVEVMQDGGRMLDAVKVIGMELPERLKTAIMVKITRTEVGRYAHYKPSMIVAYAVNEACVPQLVEHFKLKDDSVVTYEIAGEVELDVWDMLKSK